jgi:hypothetical protein
LLGCDLSPTPVAAWEAAVAQPVEQRIRNA